MVKTPNVPCCPRRTPLILRCFVSEEARCKKLKNSPDFLLSGTVRQYPERHCNLDNSQKYTG